MRWAKERRVIIWKRPKNLKIVEEGKWRQKRRRVKEAGKLRGKREKKCKRL